MAHGVDVNSLALNFIVVALLQGNFLSKYLGAKKVGVTDFSVKSLTLTSTRHKYCSRMRDKASALVLFVNRHGGHPLQP